MNILLASWAPFHAGAEAAAERLAAGLSALGHRVMVLLGTEGETLRRICDAGLDARRLPLALTDKLHWWRYQKAQRELRELLRELRPDIVHANDLPTSQMVSQAALQLGIPRICHHRWVFAGPAIDWLNKYVAERHLFVSQALMDQLCHESCKLAHSPRDVVHDGLPLPAAPTDEDRAAARIALGLKPERPLALFAGQVIARKGVADLLRAWQLLPKELSSRADLVIVGDDLEGKGRYRREMEAVAKALGCPARFVGFQRNVPQWLTAADLCVVPSHVEPLGNATLEAMAHCLPVIGAQVGGIPEMIVDRQTGLLVPPRDPTTLAFAIGSLLREPRLRETLGQAARARCEKKFSLLIHTNAIVEQYHSALNDKRAAS